MNEERDETHAPLETQAAAAFGFPGPAAAAAAIIAYYPELIDLDASTQAKVKVYIRNANDFEQFVSAVGSQGQTGWAPPSPIILENGQPAKDQQGNVINRFVLSEKTTAAMIAPLAEALNAVRADSTLENILWTIQQGVSPNTPAFEAAAALAAPSAGAAPASNQWTLKQLPPRYGVTIPSVSFDYSGNAFQLQLTNQYARHLAVYVEFLAAGEVITPSQWTSRLPAQLNAGFETATLKYLGVLAPMNHVAGMLMTAGPASISFPLPQGATSARILFGGLGAQPSGSVVEAVGAILTAVMDQALPAILLTAQQTQPGLDLSAWFNGVLADEDLRNEVIAAGGFLISGQSSLSTNSIWSALDTKVPALLLGTSLPNLAASITKNVGPTAIDNAAPYLGWAAETLDALQSPNALTQTVSQLLATPATFTLDLSPVMAANLSVNILPDPTRDEWPDVADHYKVVANFGGGLTQEANGAMPTNSSTKPLVISFSNIPMDEGVTVQVSIYDKHNWLCGSGQTAVTLSKQSGSATLKVSLSITENRIPLSESTQYSHKRKLVYDTNAQEHLWQPALAPTAVWSGSNDCPDSGNVLCRLVGITLNERARMLGYTWQASGQNLSPCGQPSINAGQLYAFQNIGAPNAQAALKFPSCGFILPTGLVYERSGPETEAATGNTYNFYLDSQTPAANAAYQVRGVTLDAQTPFNLSQTESWGAFIETGLTAFVVHPGGYLVGVSYGNSKMEILRLPAGPVADAVAPVALLTSGPGALAGLLNGPVALDVTGDGVLLVLEQDNARIQAFDVYGNPVSYFPDNSPFVSLQAEMPTPVYLDISVTDDRWIYVLSYVNTGQTAADYRLDIYTPAGAFLSRTIGVNGAKLVVDSWRRVYTLNYESFLGPGGRTEPSISQWIPS
jgi:hypothetical protein